MQVKILNEAPQRVFAVIFEIGEDPVSGLTRFAEKQDLSASSFTAIGAFSEALLGYFDWERKTMSASQCRLRRSSAVREGPSDARGGAHGDARAPEARP